jgi:hypothetical protein
MTEIAIALGRPAITPEVRAWLHHRSGAYRPVLTRGREAGLGRGAVLLRVDLQAASEAEIQEEVESLMTDLRMLGLRPTLLTTDVVSSAPAAPAG